MKVVIIGGVAGGASAAARIRRLDEHAQIIMIERSGYVSYANCGLPYYVGGVIKEQEELTLQTPESFWDRFRIDVRVRQEVTAINPAEKTVTVHALDSGKIYTETYDKLLLAPGAKPTVPALSGVSSERVFTLRTVEDTLRIRRFVEDRKPKTAVLAGGGFIGLEMAENLTEMGVSVTIVQRLNQLLAPLDADMASFVHAEMRRHGVTLRLGETVTGFRQDGDSVLTLLEESEPLRSDMVLLAIGVTPDTHLAKEAGLELGIRGSIAVNERMETSVPDIYEMCIRDIPWPAEPDISSSAPRCHRRKWAMSRGRRGRRGLRPRRRPHGPAPPPRWRSSGHQDRHRRTPWGRECPSSPACLLYTSNAPMRSPAPRPHASSRAVLVRSRR